MYRKESPPPSSSQRSSIFHIWVLFLFFVVIFFRKRKWRYYDIRFSFFSTSFFSCSEKDIEEPRRMKKTNFCTFFFPLFFPFFIRGKSIAPKRPICHSCRVVIYSPLSPSPHCVYRFAFCSPSVVVIDELPTRSRTRHLFLKGRSASNEIAVNGV